MLVKGGKNSGGPLEKRKFSLSVIRFKRVANVAEHWVISKSGLGAPCKIVSLFKRKIALKNS